MRAVAGCGWLGRLVVVGHHEHQIVQLFVSEIVYVDFSIERLQPEHLLVVALLAAEVRRRQRLLRIAALFPFFLLVVVAGNRHGSRAAFALWWLSAVAEYHLFVYGAVLLHDLLYLARDVLLGDRVAGGVEAVVERTHQHRRRGGR